MYPSSVGDILYRTYLLKEFKWWDKIYPGKTPYGLFYKRIDPNDRSMRLFCHTFSEAGLSGHRVLRLSATDGGVFHSGVWKIRIAYIGNC